jgi:hypothetical protein
VDYRPTVRFARRKKMSETRTKELSVYLQEACTLQEASDFKHILSRRTTNNAMTYGRL